MMLRVENLLVEKQGKRILGPLDLELEPERITAICGPNGAGKSTLLSALASLEGAAQGSVLLEGESVAKMHPRERAKAIGYLPQDGEVAWDVSVRNLVALGRMPHRDGAAEPVDSAIAALDLEAFADRPLSQLSGGERARALLARVLAGEPRWILADEPLAALDLAHQQALVRVFTKKARAGAGPGTGVVLVVHDLAIAMNHADRVVVLDQGMIASDGTPDTALSEDILKRVWKVQARWVGETGSRALSV
ncbi:ABC transporter ATP-binding protein [Altererythrobacter sp. MF3-039]|uniref:ABC transporter ATP-binding protein n=1 Tax=Altererythrobacter sp. MF3-039 TaxID=3252901 RepID=UPI00390CD9F7